MKSENASTSHVFDRSQLDYTWEVSDVVTLAYETGVVFTFGFLLTLLVKKFRGKHESSIPHSAAEQRQYDDVQDEYRGQLHDPTAESDRIRGGMGGGAGRSVLSGQLV